MEYLHTSLILLLLFCSPLPSTEKTFLTHLGTKCPEDCKRSNGEYKCGTIEENGECQTMYCSPEGNVDYWNRKCKNLCGKHGEEYYWCNTDIVFWGYCGLVMEDKNHYGSQTGALCYDHCDKSNEDYYWCHTEQGWDYCSPSENTDYMNKQCKKNHTCGKNGHSYNWCNLKEGGWAYCGLVEPKLLLHWSTSNHSCIDECQYHESGDYYWCHIAKGWDYCSPDVDVTYKGNPCRSDHSCGSHDYNYNWCWTSESEYDYCGPIESGECNYFPSRYCKRRAQEEKLICTQKDKHKIKRTIFTVVPAPKDITDGSQWRKETEKLISHWDNRYLDQAHSDLDHSDNLRIYRQGTINHKNQLHYDLRIQVKMSPVKSTTVSQIIVPRGIPHRYIRRAFLESFTNQARVYIDVSRQN